MNPCIVDKSPAHLFKVHKLKFLSIDNIELNFMYYLYFADKK